MALIRVYDAEGNQIGDTHRYVIAQRVTDTGALVLTNAFRPTGEPFRVVYAPNVWHHVHEWPASPDERSEQTARELGIMPDAQTAVQPVVPVSPAAPPPDSHAGRTAEMRAIADLLDGNPWESDRDRVAAAMTVPCICDELRCPVVLNAATPEEKRNVVNRMWGRSNTRSPREAEPLRRCSLITGHDAEIEHTHYDADHPFGWVWGPSNHHPNCHRHPDRYNRPGRAAQPVPAAPTEEGQPEGAGVTSVALMERSGALVRPYITELDEPSGDPGRNDEAASSWGYCATYGPERGGVRLFCMRTPHVDGPHQATTGGDTVRW